MSEKWVLVPETFIARTFGAGWAHSGEGWNGEYPDDAHERPAWLATREAAISARPPVSREWLDAAVERGARAIYERYYSGLHDIRWEAAGDVRPGWRADARAAILAALEMRDG